jgi:gluconolactonase
MSWIFEKVAGPFAGATAGLAWDGMGMLFTAVDEERLLRFDPNTGNVNEVRKHTQRANGIAFGPDHVLFGCQEAGRRIIAFMPDGSARQTAFKLDGRFHNQPIDLAVDRSGRIWFCDPHSVRRPPGVYVFPPLDHASILRLERTPHREWILRRITNDTVAPRAILLSADETVLYVADGEVGRSGIRELRAYGIASDGTVGSFSVLHSFGSDHRGEHRGIEGMCLDTFGNIVACAGWRKSGPGPLIYVFASSGAVLETHILPTDLPNRCAFGDAGLRNLYLTSMDGCLYRAEHVGRRGLAVNFVDERLSLDISKSSEGKQGAAQETERPLHPTNLRM